MFVNKVFVFGCCLVTVVKDDNAGQRRRGYRTTTTGVVRNYLLHRCCLSALVCCSERGLDLWVVSFPPWSLIKKDKGALSQVCDGAVFVGVTSSDFSVSVLLRNRDAVGEKRKKKFVLMLVDC